MPFDRRGTLRWLAAGGALLTLGTRAAFARDPVTYTYDALGRLTSATYPNGATVTYFYDSAGNRTRVTTSGVGTPPPPPPPPPGPLAASLSATSWSDGPAGPSAPVVVTATGGVPPYSYLWQKVTGNPATYAYNPTGSSTSWYFTGQIRSPWIKESTWRCQVTDSASTTVYTSNVSVSIDVS